MQYHSTRSKEESYGSKDAILQGLCGDGGLFVSDALPDTRLDIEALCNMRYDEIAEEVFAKFFTDFSREEIRHCIREAYRDQFETEPMTPVTAIGEDWLLELYHGPTAAFKDVALCMLPKLMETALKEKNEKIMVVTATSGDTGKAALSGFKDAKNIGIAVFYPNQKVSDIQYLQMATQEGENVAVCAVNGNFDDCQSEVKSIFASERAKLLLEKGIALSSANSINIGRLVPQIVYYIDAYKQLLHKNAILPGERIDFVVPTGNFGDILAGYYAKLMGLPVGHLVVASNENKVLTDFINTGVYDRNRDFVQTISPSMDILISSNLERMLYYMSGMDADYVKELMHSLRETGVFCVREDVMARIRETFLAGYADNEASRESIRRAYEETGRLIDPHTAVAYKVLRDVKASEAYREAPKKAVILSTASPYKFAEDVYKAVFSEALSGAVDGFSYMDALSERTGVMVPASLSSLKKKPVLHKAVRERAEMEAYVFEEAMRLLGENHVSD